MQTRTKTIAAGMALSLTVLLAACGNGGPSKGDLKDGLEAQDKAHPVQACWAVDNNANVSWPLRVPMNGMTQEQLGVIDGINRSGIATVTTGPFNQNGIPMMVMTVDLTDKGKSANAWDPQKGFCVGTRHVKDVNEFTIPGKGDENVTDVKYTWQYDDLPGWVERDKYPRLAGMTAPAADEAVLQKTSDGWRVQ
ncbi:hypothetical protein SAMN05216466_106199 [Paraburkholderia phenazinium]|uniref:Lipoprotein n=1 Tax=Paraburkholderia phenazinium TaxID=60549 RepID=A0A1G7YIQ2_9BURK|nr:hypothetical protein [Paraburkholderia phenazinium]SDG96186.1 hypothetical protein SAMN05216466_106199 [Paraburkholderia phenazinium]